jgi:excisionase family DNA binding protein
MEKNELKSLSPDSVARRHGLGVSTVRRGLKDGSLPFIKKGRRVLIDVEAADRWAASSGPEQLKLPFPETE